MSSDDLTEFRARLREAARTREGELATVGAITTPWPYPFPEPRVAF